MKLFLLIVVSLMTVFFGGFQPASPYPEILRREIQSLTDRGLRVKLFKGVVEAVDPLTGRKRLFNSEMLAPREPTRLGVPMLSVDLNLIDTTLYSWRFHYVNSMPLTGDWGFPLQVHDMDGNGQPEAYGYQQTQSDDYTRVFELDTSKNWNLRYTYPGEKGIIDKTGDLDNNGLREVYLRYRDSLFAYEQPALDSLPTLQKFRHRQWYLNATGIPNQVDFMTGASTPEIVYRGSEPISSEERIYVTKFDTTLKNIRRIWSSQIPPGCFSQGCPWSIATGEYDRDGKQELAMSTLAGNVYVVEHVDGDSFAVTWSTNLSVAGRAAAGDVDGNGITEFFIGGTQVETDGYVHLRAYAYERTGDNTFQPVFAFNIFPAGIFFVDLYQTADVDGDGVPELLLSFAGGIMIIRGAGEHSYEVFYYRPVSSLDGISAWRIDSSNAAHLFVSRAIGSQPIISQTDVYELDSSLVTSVGDQILLPSSVRLLHSYPNPFNSSTTISYEVPHRGHAILEIYDIAGRHVQRLVDEVQDQGTFAVQWDASSLASGIYFLRLTFGGQSFATKLIHLK
jgi:hypothetical protein